MNYGYKPTSKDPELANELARMLAAKWYHFPEIRIEVNGLYPGVRLRKLTRMSESELDQFVKDCDAIFDRFMPDLETPTPRYLAE